MELPLCLEEYEPELALTVADRRELIQRLAERGTSSIDKFITDHSADSSSGIAKLFKRLRTKLDAQISRTREKIANKYKRRTEDTLQEQRFKLEPITDDLLDAKLGGSEAKMSYLDREIDSRLMDILSRDNVLNLVINFDEDQYEAKAEYGWWARFKKAIQRFVNYLVNLFRRFVSWLKSRFSRKAKETVPKTGRKSNILLRYPSGSDLWDEIDHNLDNALATSPDFRRTIDRTLKSGYRKGVSRRRTTWKKYLNQEEYADEVRRELNHRIKAAIKREQQRLQKEYTTKKRQLKKLEQRHRDKSHQEVRKRELEARMKQLEKQKVSELKKLQKKYSKKIHKTVEKELVKELEDAGYLFQTKGKDGKPMITSRLIDRFAEIVLSDELKKLPSKHTWGKYTHGLPHGIYEKKKLQTISESSRMDIVASLVNARVSHVVLIFDKSGSMEENNRIQAAKKSVLALYKAVKHRNPKNIVDFIAFDSTVQVMDILQAWRSTPGGFTNTGEALATAHALVKDSVADRKLVYLITDGLPEAYTDPKTAEPRAGDLRKSLNVAVSEAKKLKKHFELKILLRLQLVVG
jgi:hypothetical protein